MSTSSLLPDLVDPVTTAAKRLGRFMGKIDWEHFPKSKPGEYVIPGLDVAALQQEYGMERATWPQKHQATFQVPLNVTWAQYEQIRNGAIKKWIDRQSKHGWDLYADDDHKLRVDPGVYPAHDLVSGFGLLDRREFIATAYFRFRNPKPLRIELDPKLVNPYVIKR